MDPVSSDWLDGTPDPHIGSIRKVEEFFSGQSMAQLLIQFRDPTEFFVAQAYASARAEKRISAAICGRTGRSWDAARDEQGRMFGSRQRCRRLPGKRCCNIVITSSPFCRAFCRLCSLRKTARRIKCKHLGKASP